MFPALASLGLSFNPSSSSGVGPSSFGAGFDISFGSPFAVGRGATAAVADSDNGSAAAGGPANMLPIYIAGGAAVIAAIAVIVALRRK